MNNIELKEALADLFKNGSIKIESEVRKGWTGRDLIIKVLIDHRIVYEHETEI